MWRRTTPARGGEPRRGRRGWRRRARPRAWLIVARVSSCFIRLEIGLGCSLKRGGVACRREQTAGSFGFAQVDSALVVERERAKATAVASASATAGPSTAPLAMKLREASL